MSLQPVFDLANAEVIHMRPLDEFTLDGLAPELHQFVDRNGPSGPMFDHPLYRDMHMLVTAAMPARRDYRDIEIPAGLARINAIIEEQIKCRAEAATCGQWGRYVFVHYRPYRVDALLNAIQRVGASRLWHLVGQVWRDSEDNMASAIEWGEIWSHAYDGKHGGFRKCFERVMGAPDRRAYDALPEFLTCYRGCKEEHHAYGYSWTIDREKAEWFARRRIGAGIVAKTQVHKSVVLAYFSDRKESEVVLDIDYIEGVEITHLEAPALAKAA